MNRKTFIIISSFYIFIIVGYSIFSSYDPSFYPDAHSGLVFSLFNFFNSLFILITGHISRGIFNPDLVTYFGFPFFISILAISILFRPIYFISNKLSFLWSIIIGWLMLILVHYVLLVLGSFLNL